MRTMTLFFLCLSFWIILCARSEAGDADYLNPALPTAERVRDLVGRMTLAEKVSQMCYNAPAVPRLQIPAYNWWNECLHGVARTGEATVFPQAIGMAATWDTVMMRRVADAIATEARAKYHEALRKNEHGIYRGLTFWSPNINIFRDPRWGRGQETYGEDPYLTSHLGVAFVKGLQGDDPVYFKVIATPKHFAVHSGPEPERHEFDAVISDRDLYDTYLPAFKACIREAGAFSVMCAYNRYMGDACCGSTRLLRDILRDAWGFSGYVVSDCGAISDIYMSHKLADSAPRAAALAVIAGTDLNCGQVYAEDLLAAVNTGMVSEKAVDQSVERLFTARFRLGMFDPPEIVPYAGIPIGENDSDVHRQLALKMAQESIVLLKNENNLLPLPKNLKHILVVGPNADSYAMLLGNYFGTPSRYVTPLSGIRNKIERGSEVVYIKGCDLIRDDRIINNLSSDIVQTDGKPGFKAEYFMDTRLEGEPFSTRTDPINHENWIYGTRQPNLRDIDEYAIRWTGTLTAPATGVYNFILTGDDGFRMYLDGKTITDSWEVHDGPETRNGMISLEKGRKYAIRIEYFRKSGRPVLNVRWEMPGTDQAEEAVREAENSDIVIFVGGISGELEGESMQVEYDGFHGGDRTTLDLPASQQNLLKKLHATGKPVILVLCSGSALAVNWEKEHLTAILQIWYPGEEGGTALADVLFGDYNPAGRLPVTFYQSVDQLPSFENYNMQGRTYRYFDGRPLFPFGYGLSYTTFEYSELGMPDTVQTGHMIHLSVKVRNTGRVAGDEVIQLYVTDLQSSVPVPHLSLQGFKRISLKAGEEQLCEFTLFPDQLAVTDDHNRRVVEPGIFRVTVGGILPGGDSATTGNISREIKVTGKKYYSE